MDLLDVRDNALPLKESRDEVNLFTYVIQKRLHALLIFGDYDVTMTVITKLGTERIVNIQV
jgi:hypothetical protein